MIRFTRVSSHTVPKDHVLVNKSSELMYIDSRRLCGYISRAFIQQTSPLVSFFFVKITVAALRQFSFCRVRWLDETTSRQTCRKATDSIQSAQFIFCDIIQIRYELHNFEL